VALFFAKPVLTLASLTILDSMDIAYTKELSKTMKHAALETDSAKVILNTYRAVHDTPVKKRSLLRSRLQKENQNLSLEMQELKGKYLGLQAELLHRETHLAQLHAELHSTTHCMSKLQEDFEHAISQLQQKSQQAPA